MEFTLSGSQMSLHCYLTPVMQCCALQVAVEILTPLIWYSMSRIRQMVDNAKQWNFESVQQETIQKVVCTSVAGI